MPSTKRIVMAAVASLALGAAAFGQQITRVAVIDIQKVYMTYYKDSQAVRVLEESKLAVAEEIRRLGDELKDLQKRRLDMLSTADGPTLKAFDEQLYRKAQFLSDYVKVKQAELEAKAQDLARGDAFVQTLYRTVQTISEAEGFSLVISTKDVTSVGSSVLWFSPMIDITDKVIQAMLGS